MVDTTEEVIELPAVDTKFESGDHFDSITDEEAALGHIVYKEIDDLDDEADPVLLHTPGEA